MSLNIKNEETCRLAGQLARLTGESMTAAITVALRERLDRVQQLPVDDFRDTLSSEERLREMRRIVDRVTALPDRAPWLEATAHGDFLYGEDGLPR